MIWFALAMLVAVIWLAWLFNSLVTLHNQADAAWADIDVQLRRRYDLVPNLVAVVKGYAAHESATFERVAVARTAALDAYTPAEKNQTEPALLNQMRSVFALAESYPELKANEEFLNLQKSLAEIEDNVQSARGEYNARVRDLANQNQRFPNNLIAPLFGVHQRDYFHLDAPSQAAAGRVEFGGSR